MSVCSAMRRTRDTGAVIASSGSTGVRFWRVIMLTTWYGANFLAGQLGGCRSEGLALRRASYRSDRRSVRSFISFRAALLRA